MNNKASINQQNNSMPSFKTSQVDEEGKAVYKDVCYPSTKEFKNALQKEVFAVYQESKEIQKEGAEAENPFVEGMEGKEVKTPSHKKESEAQKKTSIKEKIAQGEDKKEKKPQTRKQASKGAERT